MEQDESGYYEPTNYDLKYKGKSRDKYNCINGNYKTPVSTRSHLLDQKRHSLGRIYVHGHVSHHGKQMPVRAHSMQTDQHPCSPLAQESERRHSTVEEWRQNENVPSRLSLNKSQDIHLSSSTEQCKQQVKLRPTRQERVLQKQISIHEQDNYTSCILPAQDFLYIDEVPQPTKMVATNSNEAPNTEYNDTPRNVRINGSNFNDNCSANIGEYSMDAFKRETTRLTQPKPVEMKTQCQTKLFHDHVAMEEHAV